MDSVSDKGYMYEEAIYDVSTNVRRCLEGENGLFQSALLKEVVIEHM